MWERDETSNHIKTESSKLAKNEYKTRHEWMDKVIHCELFKKLKFPHTNKWYMHNPESVVGNETHEILWDFERQTDHLISASRPDVVIVNKKKKEVLLNIEICHPPADHRVKIKENKKRDKHLHLAGELKKQWNMKVTVIPIMISALGTIPKCLKRD